MNTKLYWQIRDRLIKFVFFIKKIWYSITSKIHQEKKIKSFSFLILKTVIQQSIKSVFLCVLVLTIDGILIKLISKEMLSNQLFLDIVIGGIGVAGVILGLYCSNMAAMYSSKYTNAPESISKLYQRDVINNKCVKQIVAYIIFCICLLSVCILEIPFYYATVSILLYLTIRTIVAFSVSGNRAYELSNTYRISDVIYPDILYIIEKLAQRTSIDGDKNFQNHYKKLCANYIGALKDIALYNKINSDRQTSPLVTFLKSNVAVLYAYAKIKPYIPYDSLWFPEKPQYQQWHIASDTEITTKIKFGLMLDTKEVKDYMWFETKFEEINQICFDTLMETKDYSAIYTYLALIAQLPEEISDRNSIIYWNQYIKSLNKFLLPIILGVQDNRSNESGIADAYATVCFNFIMSICTYIAKLDVDSILNYATSIRSYDGADVKESKYLNNDGVRKLYHLISTEVKIEQQQITPVWYIEQVIGKEIYDEINLLATQMVDMLEFAFSIGEKLLANKSYYNAAIWFCRLSELDAKISHQKICQKLCALEKQLLGKKKDSKVIWNESNIGQSISRVKDISRTTPHLLKKCSGIFAMTHKENRTEFPDMFGYCYNRLCDCLINAIAQNDYETFESLYSDFLAVTLLYQEYIRVDVIKHQEEHMQRAVFHVFSAPIFEFAIISSLAILWGEFVGLQGWRASVEKEIRPYTDESKPEMYRVLSQIGQIISARKGALIGVGNRDIIETGWVQTVSAAIRNHPNYKVEHGKYGQKYAVSDSELFATFANHCFFDLEVLHDVEEVFCVLYINPYVGEKERYHTRSKWEEELDKKDEE